MPTQEKKKAPAFSLQDQHDITHRLSDYARKIVLVYFYPKDDTPGCTTEACAFRDAMNDFKKHGISVLGISTDSTASHKKFAEKFKLNFPLLADTEKKVVEQYGVWVEKSMYGKTYMGVQRDSFLIGPNGTILKHYVKVKPAEHVAEVLAHVST